MALGKACAVLATLAAATWLPASASGLTVYTSSAEWETAVAGLVVQVETFNDATEGTLPAGTTVIQPKAILSITLDSNNQGVVKILEATDKLNGLEFQGRICDQTLPASVCAPKQLYLDFQTAAPVVAFAADWAGTTEQDVLTIGIGGTITALNQVPNFSGTGFLGFVDTTPFSTVTFGLANARPGAVLEGFRMDNLRIAEVPLPAGLALLGSSMAVLGLARRRTRRVG